MKLDTYTVGQNFGTAATLTLGGAKFESDVVPFGFDSSARRQAISLAVEAGVLTRLGELTALVTEAHLSALDRAGFLVIDDELFASGRVNEGLAADRAELILAQVTA